MTVTTELRRKSFPWSGVETSFACGFPADRPEDLALLFRTPVGAEVPLSQGVHYSVTLSSSTKLATLAPIALPAGPGTLVAIRTTPALVREVFADAQTFPAAVHQRLHDRGAMRDAENRDDGVRALRLSPGSVDGSGEYLARGNRITDLGAPILDGDAVSRGYLFGQLGNIPIALEAADLAVTAAAVISGLLNEPLDDGNQFEGSPELYDDGVQGS